MENVIRKPENPAKVFLRRYRAIIARQESLQRAIDAAYEMALSCTQRLRPVHVSGGGGAYDRVADDIAVAIDETETLRKAKDDGDRALAEIMRAIDAVPDELQKTVLIMRYVEGLGWLEIAEKIHYEISNTYIIHGRALWNVRKWMDKRE